MPIYLVGSVWFAQADALKVITDKSYMPTHHDLLEYTCTSISLKLSVRIYMATCI